MKDQFKYLQRNEINTAKWDECIEHATNRLIYAFSFYLDAVCDHWSAIVWGDYKAVMPLPWKKKYGITYVYTPLFIQQLGIFSCRNVPDFIPELAGLIEKKLSFGEYFLNHQDTLQSKPYSNFILDLNPNYTVIQEKYKSSLKHDLKKAKNHKLIYSEISDFKKAITVHHKIYGSRTPHVKLSDITVFVNLCAFLQQKNCLIIREVKDAENNLLAISLCFKYKDRLYLWISSTTNIGRKFKANHFLLDCLIQEYSGNKIVLDFVGSNLPGVFNFYKSFGGINQPYSLYRWNKLPWPFKYFKKG